MIAILGGGRLAAACAAKLAPAAVWSRKRAQARAIARGARGVRAAATLDDALDGASVVLLAVPDGAVLALAARIAKTRASWRGMAVLHAAGAYGPELLAPLAARGASVGVLHPMAALGAGGRGVLAGASARIEGDPPARAAARRIARRLGLVPLPRPVRSRAVYHAAASLGSNDVLALLLGARDLLVTAGMPRRAAERALVALAEGTIATARRAGLEAALSGPVVRGDAKTVAAQLAVLDRTDAELGDVHRALSRRLAATARRPRALSASLAPLLARGRRRRGTV